MFLDSVEKKKAGFLEATVVSVLFLGSFAKAFEMTYISLLIGKELDQI